MNALERELADTIIRSIGTISDELTSIKQAVTAMTGGQPFEESPYEKVKKDLRSDLVGLMENILCLKYSIVNRYHNYGYKRANRYILDIRGMVWDPRPDSRLIDYLNDIREDAYAEAVKNYNEFAEFDLDLIPNKAYIPKECPWEIKMPFSISIPQMLNKLPDPGWLPVQMMLYSTICEYRDSNRLNDSIIGKKCSDEWCPHYSNCVSKYFEMRYGGNNQ